MRICMFRWIFCNKHTTHEYVTNKQNLQDIGLRFFVEQGRVVDHLLRLAVGLQILVIGHTCTADKLAPTVRPSEKSSNLNGRIKFSRLSK